METTSHDNSAHTMFGSDESRTPAGHLLYEPSNVGSENRESIVRQVASKMGVDVNDIENLSIGTSDDGDVADFEVTTDGERHGVEVRIDKEDLGESARISLRVEVDDDEIGAGDIEIGTGEPFVKSKLRNLVDDTINDFEVPHDGPRNPVDKYRDVFVEGQQLMADSSSSPCRLMRDTLSYITGQLYGQPLRDLKGEVWESGQGEVHEETIEAVELIRDGITEGDTSKVDEVIDLAVNAHGNSRASDYERWSKRFKKDLERLDLEPIDWDRRRDKEGRKAHEAFREAQATMRKVQERLDGLESKANTNRHVDTDEPKEAFMEARECRRELERIANQLDDPLFTGIDNDDK